MFRETDRRKELLRETLEMGASSGEVTLKKQLSGRQLEEEFCIEVILRDRFGLWLGTVYGRHEICRMSCKIYVCETSKEQRRITC